LGAFFAVFRFRSGRYAAWLLRQPSVARTPIPCAKKKYTVMTVILQRAGGIGDILFYVNVYFLNRTFCNLPYLFSIPIQTMSPQIVLASHKLTTFYIIK
jgi:hypothetical protein